jgi:hypothetical protein
MTGEMVTAATGVVVAVVSAGASVWAGRSARRTKRQEKRDDFTVVTDRMDREIARQGSRIDELETESEQQRTRLTGQDFTIRYLTNWVRSLYGVIRTSEIEPPVPPQPMPPEVQQYLHDIGV